MASMTHLHAAHVLAQPGRRQPSAVHLQDRQRGMRTRCQPLAEDTFSAAGRAMSGWRATALWRTHTIVHPHLMGGLEAGHPGKLSLRYTDA